MVFSTSKNKNNYKIGASYNKILKREHKSQFKEYF